MFSYIAFHRKIKPVKCELFFNPIPLTKVLLMGKLVT